MSYPQYPSPAPKPGMSTGKKIGLFGCAIPFVGLLLMGGCMAAIMPASEPESDAAASEPSGDSEAQDAGNDSESEPEESSGASEDSEAAATVGDGIHRVGEDIEPGTYITEGPDPDGIVPMCYYARLSGLSGELDDVIANNNLEGSGTVEVSESDTALELSGGCEWEPVD